MKSKVAYSKFVVISTAIISLLLFAGCLLTIREQAPFIIILSVFLILIIASLLYGVAYIEGDSCHVFLGSILKRKKILNRNIETIEAFQPTMGAIRICGSGGFMGYWGLFKEGDIGRYYAFYGRSSDCFLYKNEKWRQVCTWVRQSR